MQTWTYRHVHLFSARQHVLNALYAIARPSVSPFNGHTGGSIVITTRNTLDCDKSNVYSSRAVFSAISQGLFRSSSLYRRSAGDPAL